ncbi:MAG: hypothetical protein GQ529_12460 [Methyloprofundus sp.]|nr:hypothetical protein [Methyloprofundus sp.]
MQIREQGNKIQLIRTHYLPEKKRTEGKVFATFDKSLYVIPEDIRLKIDKDETDKLEKYLLERKEKEILEDLRFNLLNISTAMSKAKKALAIREINELSVDKANLIYSETAALIKALRKAGFSRPTSKTNGT